MRDPFQPMAAAEKRSSGWTVFAYSRGTDGLYTPERWFQRLELDVSAEALTAVCIEALHVAQDSVETEYRIWEILGYRSRSAYARGAKQVMISLLRPSDLYKVTPMRRVGSGFENPPATASLDVVLSAGAELGSAVLESIENAV